MKHARFQLALPFRKRGGARPRSGPKPKDGKAGMPHRSRPAHAARNPVHVSLKVGPQLPNLRGPACFAVVAKALRAGRERPGFQLVHWSVQSNHLHLIVEAEGKAVLWRGLRSLQTRLAMRLNRALGRRGRVFHDRYHQHELRSPRETARALDYVLRNFAHHLERQGYRVPADAQDACASSAWPPQIGEGLAVRPRTWLLTVGWQRGWA